eukprot:CAMPEP_0204488060 /NCGR_PEP_ID=MMETSP0471-20130131/68713_1 /ASSEMBLY_ACC=CAM_ASM_000602 /TAXON_ID=2969 /ORGANISM="Oxyrrhis marina" /LENGTH=68 /DNA_ID=CAMNT_0051491787 /DNA_START=496 /DNA_END=698 /DNA_ORIENTATION=-
MSWLLKLAMDSSCLKTETLSCFGTTVSKRVMATDGVEVSAVVSSLCVTVAHLPSAQEEVITFWVPSIR